MLYREIIAVCSEIQTGYINILCGQKEHYNQAYLLTFCLVLRVVTNRLERFKKKHKPARLPTKQSS
jgi:hypothetical protein